MTELLKKALTASVAGFICISAFSQQGARQSWFVDGFHGGVYGHYPLKTYTDYMMGLLEKYPDWSMCIEIEPETWDSVKVVAPVSYDRYRKAVLSDRVECTNPTYAQPYMYNIPGESIIRQFHYGIRKMHRHFPEMTFSTYAVEEPCFTSALPQILKGFGFKYASLKCPNTCWGGYYAPVEGELVNWTGPDGSSVLCSPRYSFEKLSDENVFSTLANNNCDEYLDSAANNGFTCPVGMTYQDAGWEFGPWLESQWRDFGERRPVSSRYTTWKNYFENIAADVQPVEYISSQEDVRGSLMWGTQVMQNIARSVRAAENDIIRAEKMGAMANIANGFDFDEKNIDEGWRTLLLSQHHDSWIVPYNNLKNRGTWADWICNDWTVSTRRIANREISRAQISYYDNIDKDDSENNMGIRVFNTDGNARIEVLSAELPARLSGKDLILTDAFGNVVESVTDIVDGEARLLFKANVPAFGYASYNVRENGDMHQVRKTPYQATVLENDMYKVVFDKKRGGIIKSLISIKDGGRELVQRGEYGFGELKGFFYNENMFLSSADAPALVTIVEDNEFEKKARVTGMIGSHPFVETITLRAGESLIDIDLHIDWNGNPGIGKAQQTDAYANPERAFYDDRYHLNIYFPASAVSPELYKSAPFDICKSGLDDTAFSNWHDIKHNVILDWVSLEGADRGLGLMTDHTTSYVYGGGRPLALTVQASGNGLWGRDYKINGPTDMRIAILPHMGGWKSVADGYRSWNEPLDYAFSTKFSIEDSSLMDCGGYELSAAYVEGDDIIVRLFNRNTASESRRVGLAPSIVSIEEIDLLGNAIRKFEIQNGSFEVSMPGLGFRTFRLGKSSASNKNINK
ncbi:MAG: alpha-mannosidase [Candidatus Cryptobacteroides sp.]|nr:alpha-mannosidase [Candidatus Cryptobacteroides sp.]